MPIAVIKALFCPDVHQLQRTLDSIVSFDQFISSLKQTAPSSSSAITVYLHGWFGSPDASNATWVQFNQELARLPSLVAATVSVRRTRTNIGKSAVVNAIVASLPATDRYVFFMDSDIVIPLSSSADMLQRLTTLCDTVEVQNVCVAAIALNQTGDCKHHALIYENSHAVTCSRQSQQSERVLFPNDGFGIAGGAIFTTRELLLRCKLPSVGAFGPDDALWIKYLFQQALPVVVAEGIKVHHPFDSQSAHKLQHLQQYSTIKPTTAAFASAPVPPPPSPAVVTLVDNPHGAPPKSALTIATINPAATLTST
jgi:hypothetical protein